MRHVILGTACLMVGMVGAGVEGATFNFESTPATYTDPPGGARTGALTSLTLTDGGLSLVITREGGGRFDITSNTGNQVGKPASWGVRSLDGFFAETSATAFIGDFSSAVTSVTIGMGDYGGDFDTLLLQAYSGPGATGTLLDFDTAVYGSSAFPTIGVTSVGGPGIASIRFIGGSTTFPNSVFYDNIVAEGADVVPLPGASVGGMVLMAGMGMGRRRAR